ncbi:hypothetical protein ACF8FB_25950 [Pseudomonas sp. yb_2]|uniref:hypothetical protein n=1 Tax=Pseudomonas sp. yb_2 TaxID=3367218 RepID=UPI00370B2C9A
MGLEGFRVRALLAHGKPRDLRLSRTGATQLFIGVYAGTGVVLHEEAFLSRPGESMTRALAWSVGRARCLATNQQPADRQVA